ncbi:hypothetical protein A3D06_02220, partial [Candidatus Roizmanbacteria bacterium RIFCSPHIGHO2_02_FULL_40_9]
DLHIHLGATTSPYFLWELAHRQGIRLPEKNYWKFIDLVTIHKKIASKVYLKKITPSTQGTPSPFELTHKIQSSPLAVEECVHRALSDAYRNMRADLIELRFNPMFRNREGEHDLDKVIFAAVTGLKRACIEYPIKAGIILETDRQFNKEQHMIIARKAVEFKSYGIVGMDISGPSPEKFSFDDFVEAAEYVRSHGLGLTVHTGEFTGPDEVREVVEKIKPHRIGHGISAVKDPTLLREIARKGIVLELCPTSNIKTGVVKNWDELKNIINILKKYEIGFTINSDGPEFLSTDVKKEFQLLLQKKIITQEDAEHVIHLSHTASFVQ